MLVSQMLAVSGIVEIQVEIVKGDAKGAFFALWIDVETDPSLGVLDYENYMSWNAWMLESVRNLIVVGPEAGRMRWIILVLLQLQRG